MVERGRLRIGELSKRVGESPELLRAWEARYGLVSPERTAGGLRLYSEQDERRVRVMRHYIDAGLSASEAARLAKRADDPQPEAELPALTGLGTELDQSFEALDEEGAQVILDRILIASGLRQALSAVILPCLHRLGQLWASGQISVAEEHFASNVIGGRLRSLARGWGQGVGPMAILACPPGERHDLGLLAFGLALRERGWRITYLGADTPLGDITATVDELAPAIVVLAAVTAERFNDSADEIRTLAAHARVGLGGAGASAALADRLNAESLAGDLLEVSDALAP